MEIRMNSEKRDSYMDFLKGVAVLAVIIGHSIVDISRVNFLFQIIYSFHMPLLIFLSAYIEEENRAGYAGREGVMLRRRISGLLLPYLSWTILYTVLVPGAAGNISIEERLVQIGQRLMGYEQSGLWFFPVLCGLKVMHFLYWAMQKRCRRHMLQTDLLLCFVVEFFVVVLAVWTRQPYVINMLSYAIPYFAAVLLADHEVLQRLSQTEWVAAGVVLLYGILFPFFSFQNPGWTTQALRILLSMCVIVLCCKARSGWREHAGNRLVCLCGRNSLAIYVLHAFFMDYKIYLYEIRSVALMLFLAVLAACMVAAVCIGIARFVRISSWWSMLLLGERRK